MAEAGVPGDENLLAKVTRAAIRELAGVEGLQLSDVKAWVKGLDLDDPDARSFRRIALMNAGWYKILWTRVTRAQR